MTLWLLQTLGSAVAFALAYLVLIWVLHLLGYEVVFYVRRREDRP